MPVLLIVVFIDTVGFGIILPLQPFFAKELGAADSVVTLVAASYTAAQLVFAPLWGTLSDRVGRRPVIVATVSGTAIGYAALAFADSLWMLFAARAFGGAMAGNMGVAQAYIADITPGRGRARAMGRVGAAAGLGFVVGPALGGLLAGSDPMNPAVHIPFLTAAASSAVALALAVLVLREPARAPEPAGERRTAPLNGRWFAIARGRPQLVLLIGMMFLTPFVFAGVETILALWSARALGWGASQNGLLYTYMGAVAVVVQGGMVGPIVGRLGERRAVLLGAAAVALGAASLPFSTGFAWLMWGLGLIVFGVSITGPSLQSLVSAHATPHDRGRLMGVAASSGGLGRFLGPATSGATFQYLGPDWPFAVGAAAMGILCLLARRIRAHGPDNA